MIPIKYNVRNLRVRWATTLMTVLGTGAVVWCSCILFGMVEGLQHSLKVSGDPLDLIVLRKGADAETTSGIDKKTADEMSTLDGIARDERGLPLIAGELLSIPVVQRANGTRTNLIVRGIQPASRALRPDFKITEGRDLELGRGECIVPKLLAGRFKGANIGGVIRCGDRESYRVVGIFTAGGSSAESEIWVDEKDLSRALNRESSVSCIQLRAVSPEALGRLKKTISSNDQFKLDPLSEVDYFAKQTQSSIFLQVFGTVIAVLLTIGALFSAANTMFAAVSSRTREIGTMRALGFSRSDVLISFMSESLLLCMLGGAVGLLATIPLSALTFGTLSSDTFSELTVNFRLGPTVMIIAVGMTAVMGLFGGLFPAIRAVRLDVISALREL
ncbi:ABC transporter permease [Isosphaeraceae bacterium EP7]